GWRCAGRALWLSLHDFFAGGPGFHPANVWLWDLYQSPAVVRLPPPDLATWQYVHGLRSLVAYLGRAWAQGAAAAINAHAMVRERKWFAIDNLLIPFPTPEVSQFLPREAQTGDS
ncbi:MAG: hypothetical protein ACKO5K_07385, partial [Armatimonadota bacterium]